MHNLYRSAAAFYECLITIVIALLRTTAAQKKIMYYPLESLPANSPWPIPPMKLFKVLAKEKILRVHVKGKSCNSPESLELY